jgi:hypothetical protein
MPNDFARAWIAARCDGVWSTGIGLDVWAGSLGGVANGGVEGIRGPQAATSKIIIVETTIKRFIVDTPFTAEDDSKPTFVPKIRTTITGTNLCPIFPPIHLTFSPGSL